MVLIHIFYYLIGSSCYSNALYFRTYLAPVVVDDTNGLIFCGNIIGYSSLRVCDLRENHFAGLTAADYHGTFFVAFCVGIFYSDESLFEQESETAHPDKSQDSVET